MEVRRREKILTLFKSEGVKKWGEGKEEGEEEEEEEEVGVVVVEEEEEEGEEEGGGSARSNEKEWGMERSL